MFVFNRKYFFLAAVLFVVEVLIAIYVKDRFVRPYFGDYLVVILIYCLVRAVLPGRATKIAIGVLLFAFLIEWLQYVNIIAILGLHQNALATVVLGNRFEWLDMLAYTLGIATVLVLEKMNGVRAKKSYA